MDSASQDHQDKLSGTPPDIIPGKRTVLLFIASIGIAVLLVVAGVAAAVYQSGQTQANSNHQWCSVMKLLTANPVAKPSDPNANPSRVFAYELYKDFRSIEVTFGC